MSVPPVLGAFIFAIGILSIFHLKLHLFTGKVPYVKSIKESLNIVIIFLGNLLGCSIMWLYPTDVAITVIHNKLDEPLLLIFIEAVLCNILIYIAVEAYKNKDIITIILAVSTFILAGLEHSIANMCFIMSGRIVNWDTICLLLVSAVGNATGGILIHNIHKRL